MNIPSGASHYSDFYDIIIFYKFGIYQQKTYNYEEHSCWFYWDGNNWVKDISVRSTHFKKLNTIQGQVS